MKRKISLLFILLTLPAALCNIDEHYCELESCPNRTHTACQYKPNVFGNCGISIDAGLSQSEVNLTLTLHNEFRISTISNKYQHIVGYPHFLLEWDDELAYIAQRWANQCQHMNDKCRNVVRFNVDQRVHYDKRAANLPRGTINGAISQWYSNEIHKAKCRFKNLRFKVASSSRAQYKEMIWGNTDRIGCGATRSTTADGLHKNFYVVCNYGKK